jgi:hypothetical protein
MLVLSRLPKGTQLFFGTHLAERSIVCRSSSQALKKSIEPRYRFSSEMLDRYFRHGRRQRVPVH